MSVTLDPRILELIASRICHDLVSPVGAISNGVELIEDMGDGAEKEALNLISSSATQAAIRLKCFRLAYGAAGTDKNVGLRDVRDTFLPWISAGRVTAEFAQGLELRYSMPPRGFLKCVLNLLILAEECGKGDAKILIEDAGDGLKVTVTGRQTGFRDGAESALDGKTPVEDLDARAVHAYITGRFAQHFGFALTRKAVEGGIEFTLKV